MHAEARRNEPMNATLRSRFVDDGVAMLSNERLLLALYDRLLADLDGAATAIGARLPADAHEKLVHAQRIVEELQLALDADVWAGARELSAIYRHTTALLIEANLSKDAGPVAECRTLVEPLAEAWRSAYQSTNSPAAMTAARPVAAGAKSWGA
jgi:flagellar protein FliS